MSMEMLGVCQTIGTASRDRMNECYTPRRYFDDGGAEEERPGSSSTVFTCNDFRILWSCCIRRRSIWRRLSLLLRIFVCVGKGHDRYGARGLDERFGCRPNTVMLRCMFTQIGKIIKDWGRSHLYMSVLLRVHGAFNRLCQVGRACCRCGRIRAIFSTCQTGRACFRSNQGSITRSLAHVKQDVRMLSLESVFMLLMLAGKAAFTRLL
jgi:hypothetical protein